MGSSSSRKPPPTITFNTTKKNHNNDPSSLLDEIHGISNAHYKVFVLGLERSGKTSILKRMSGAKDSQIRVGYHNNTGGTVHVVLSKVEMVEYYSKLGARKNGMSIVSWDMGGTHNTVKPAW